MGDSAQDPADEQPLPVCQGTASQEQLGYTRLMRQVRLVKPLHTRMFSGGRQRHRGAASRREHHGPFRGSAIGVLAETGL